MRFFLMSACVIVATSCSSAADVQRTITVKDSAHVRIFENREALSFESGEEVALPSLQIGSESESSGAVLYNIRTARLLTDGRIAVADGGSGSVHIYDRSAKLRTSLGRTGEGPGEFRALFTISVTTADTILAFDAAGAKIAVFTTDGFHREFRLQAPSSDDPVPIMIGASGGLVVAALLQFTASRQEAVIQPRVRYLLYDLEGQVLDTLGVGRAQERARLTVDGASTMQLLPFGRRTLATLIPGAPLVLVDDRGRELQVIGRGGVRSIWRWAASDVSVTPEEWHAFADSMVRDRPEPSQPFWRGVFEQLPIPTSRPFFHGIIGAASGVVWLQSSEDPSRWVAVREAASIASVKFPATFEPTEFGDDYVLGVWTDELDREFVHLFDLANPLEPI